MGRFVTQDPIGNWGDGANWGNAQAYVGSTPAAAGDPFGLLTYYGNGGGGGFGGGFSPGANLGPDGCSFPDPSATNNQGMAGQGGGNQGRDDSERYRRYGRCMFHGGDEHYKAYYWWQGASPAERRAYLEAHGSDFYTAWGAVSDVATDVALAAAATAAVLTGAAEIGAGLAALAEAGSLLAAAGTTTGAAALVLETTAAAETAAGTLQVLQGAIAVAAGGAVLFDEAIEAHHVHPKALGGQNGPTVPLEQKVHKELHRRLSRFLNKIEKDGCSMLPKRGNPGADVRANFSPEEILRALRRFYNQNKKAFPEARKAFMRHFRKTIK